jgi:hypothetical protein
MYQFFYSMRISQPWVLVRRGPLSVPFWAWGAPVEVADEPVEFEK